MIKTVFQIAAYMLISIPLAHSQNKNDSMVLAPFGTVQLYLPEGSPESVTIMISGDAGWKYGVIDFAKHFAQKNSLVIGVDIREYRKDLISRKESCYHIASDFVTLATTIEKKYKLQQYLQPILMGYSSGASLVYALLAQARPHTFKGGISLGFCPDVELPKRFCEINGLKEHPLVGGMGFDLDPDSQLGNRWIVLHGKLDKVCDYRTTKAFMDKTADAELIELDNVGHGFGKWADFMPQWEQGYQSLLNEKSGETDTVPLKSYSTGDTSRLPITLTKAEGQVSSAPMCLFISGDGGWYSLEQELADCMAQLGIPTLGLDAKLYFWNRRTPQETAKDMAHLIREYEDLWHRNRIVFIGYSLGADVLPFIIENLPKDIQQKIQGTLLLSPDPNADFEIHLTDMVGLGNADDKYNVVDAIKRIGQYGHVVIVTGSEEHSALSQDLLGTPVVFDTVAGDHHYNHKVQAIYTIIKSWVFRAF